MTMTFALLNLLMVGKQGESFLLARSDASRQSGFPRMAKHNGQVVFAWSHTDSLTAVKTVLIKMK